METHQSDDEDPVLGAPIDRTTVTPYRQGMLTQPTRDFNLVLDPHCLEGLFARPLVGALTLISRLADLAPPIFIRLVVPAYLATGDQLTLAELHAESGILPFTLLADDETVPALALSRDLRRRARERIERGAEGDCRGLRLLALADYFKADGIVTSLPSLVEPRYDLLRHHRFRVLPPEELPDFVEVCARGHGVPCAALPSAPSYLPAGAMYQFAHWKGRRLFAWFNAVVSTLSGESHLRELLRSALLNRYAFILRARDMVLFYRFQADWHARRGGRMPTFREPLNYHLTAFYTHLWGMLDALAQVANRRLGLGVDPFRCHITRDDFLDPLGEKHPGLRRFLSEHGGEWIAAIGDVRHPVAHSALRLQHDVLAETAESKKSGEEIRAILRDDDPLFYDVFPLELVKQWELVMIANWRIDQMKVISDDVIYVEEAKGGYFRQPVASIDLDVERLNAFVDAFLIGCFG